MSSNRDFAASVLRTISDLHSLRDVVLIAGADQQKFSVHWVIVAASCDSFKAMPKPVNRHTVNNVAGSTLKSIIDYCYSGHIEITVNNINAVVEAASHLQIEPLRLQCIQFWKANLTTENCVQLMLRTVNNGLCGELWQTSLEFMGARFDRIPVEQMVEMDVLSFRMLLVQKQITAPETYIFQIMAKWIQHDATERAQFVGTLLNYIQPKYLPTKFMKEIVEPFCKDYDCIKFALNEYQRRSCEDAVNTFPHDKFHARGIYGAFSASSADGTRIVIRKYIFASNNWHKIREITIPSNEPIHNYGLARRGGKIFIMGGKSANGTVFSKRMWSYDLKTGIETRLPDLLTGRANFTPIIVDDYIYVFGGSEEVDICGNEQNTFARFHTGLNVWEPLKPLTKVHPNDKICHAIALNGKIYALATIWLFTEVFCYDIQANKWTQCGCDELDTNSWQDTVLLKPKNKFIYAIGRDARVHLYDTEEQTWEEIGRMKNGEVIVRAITFVGKNYTLFQSQNGEGISFGKLDIQECVVTPLTTLPYDINSPFLLFVF